jgi:hypothetical protein
MKEASMTPNKPTKQSFDYFGEYNNMLSKVAFKFGDRFAAIASPTLNKQETVTSAYESIKEGTSHGLKKPDFPWRQIWEFVPRLTWMFLRVMYASLRFRVYSIPEGALYFRTWLVPRSFSGSDITDDYFRQLPVDLRAREEVVTGFSTLGFGLLNKYAQTHKDNTQIIAWGLLGMTDVIKLFFDYISSALIQTKDKYYLSGIEVTSYINKSLLLDYLELRSFEAYAEKYKCHKLISYKIQAFVYVFENQSWEKACCATFRNSGIRLIGYQSSGFSSVFLNFFPTEDDAIQQYMPDVLLTVGDYFTRYLTENGHYKIPVQTFAALRFSYPILCGRYVIPPSNSNVFGRILYALPVHTDQYADTIKDLISVFQNSKIGVHLKLHPLYQLDDIKDVPPLPSNFKVMAEVDIDSLRETYDCVLFHDNSFGIEALMKGVKSYQYSRNGSFADNRFMYFDLWPVNYLLVDICKLREAIESGSYDKVFDIAAVSAYVNEMYRPYGPSSLSLFREMLIPTVSTYKFDK